MNLKFLHVLTCSFIICMIMLSTLPVLSQSCPATYVERNGFVVIEAEAANNLPSAWNRRTNIRGYTGSSYLRYEGTNNFRTPGRNVYSFKFYVASAGTFRFQWRNRIAKGSNSTEHNDAWLRFPDAADFFGKRGNSTVYPKGSGKFPTAEGAGGNGWFKVYTNDLNEWTYQTVTSDFDAHDIFVRFNRAGVYTVQVAGRSNGHAIDRLVLYRTNKSTSEATNPSLSVTRCTSGGTQNQSPTVQAGSNRTIQLPDNDVTLTANASDPDGSISSYSWSKVSGPSAELSGRNKRSLQVNNMVEGTYEFRVTVRDNDGATASDNVKVFVKSESDPEPPVSGSVTLSLYNARTDQPISGFNPISNGAVIDLSKTGKSLTIVANTTGDARSVTFNYNGQKEYKVEGSEPFSLGGDIGVDLQPWDYKLGGNTLEAVVGGPNAVIARTTVNFSIVDGTIDPEPPFSDGITLSLVNTNTNAPISGFNPLTDGAVVDVSIVGNDLSIIANASEEVEKVIFSYNGQQGYRVEGVAPFAINGDIGVNIQPWDYELGDNQVTAIAYDGSGNVFATNSVTFQIVEDAVNPEPPVVPGGVSFTLYNAVTDRPINGFSPLVDGQTIDLSQTGKSLSIVVNATSEADLVKFDYNGQNSFKVEGAAPFSIAGDIGDNLLPFTPPLGTNRLTAIVEDSRGNVIGERSITFNVVDGSNARFAGDSKKGNSSTSSGVEKSVIANETPTIHPNPAQDYINLYTPEDAVVTLYSNTGRVVKSIKLAGGNSKISVANLKPGVYNIQVQEQSGLNSFRIIKR